MAIIRTERLELRPCRETDREAFMDLERDAEVMRYLNGGSVDYAKANPSEMPFLMPRGTEDHVWTARRMEGSFVGWFSLIPSSANSAELGYRLCRAAWGEGLATEGAAALVDWGFATGGYWEITATTMAVNLSSRRVMEKLGMSHEETRFELYPDPIPGSEHGDVFYVVRRDPRSA